MVAVIADGRWGKRAVRFWRDYASVDTLTWGVRSLLYAGELIRDEAGIRIAAYADAIASNRMIAVAMPPQDLQPWAREQATRLKGKLVMDMSYPLTAECRKLYGWSVSGTELLQQALPDSKVVGVKSALLHHSFGEIETCYVTGDDAQAKAEVIRLLCAHSSRIIDAGALEENRAIDRMISIGVV